MKLLHSFTLLVLLYTGIALVLPADTHALSGSDFQASRIIDDSIFFTNTNITPNDIQIFLNAKVPTCDTNGTKMRGSTTRAAYGTSSGYPPPYICMKDFVQDTPSKVAEMGLCGQYNGGTKSAAQIIFDISSACGVNSRALIVLLEKEQSLITDDWPWSSQYRSATGYGCPDTAPCDSEYYGFFNQVYNAARQFKKYQRDQTSFRYRANRDNFIQYNPNAACNGNNVYIQNQATAGLYNYTPYQPNAAALNNLNGSGDDCSAYGNRNFWRIYNNWFGAVNGPPYFWQSAGQQTYADSSMTNTFSSVTTVKPGNKFYVRIQARNQGYQTWDKSNTYLGTSRPQDRTSAFYDPSWISQRRVARLVETSVAPGSVGTFEFVMNAPAAAGSYYEFFNVLVEGTTWLNDIGLAIPVNVVEKTDPNLANNSVLSPGESIKTNEYLLSPDSQTSLLLRDDGNLVLYGNFKQLWSTQTANKSVNTLLMQNDGNLVLYDGSGSPLWSSQTQGNSDAQLVMQTDGNAVIYSKSGAPLWSVRVAHNPDHLSFVNTELVTTLLPGQSIETADRKYKLILQNDGNLVLYSTRRAIWSSSTSGTQATKVIMQGDGNLVIYDKSGRSPWNSSTYGHVDSRLVIQADGNLVIYDGTGKPTWSSVTSGVQ